MQPYSNPHTNVTGYEPGPDFIRVRFKDGSVYTYTDASAGPQAIAEMKRLAAQGSGLNGYINRHVRNGYASKT